MSPNLRRRMLRVRNVTLRIVQSEAGVIPRLMHELFNTIDSLEGCEVLVQLSLVEIYNERVHDLFFHVLSDSAAPGAAQSRAPPSPRAPSTPIRAGSSRRQSRAGGVATPVEQRTPAKRRASLAGKQAVTPRGRTGSTLAPSPALRLRQDSANGGVVFVEGAARVAVANAESALGLLGQGLATRAVGCTRMNADSSRSHCVLLCDIDVLDAQHGSRRSARITLVDLAGSEAVRKTGARGVTLDEAKTINKSLSALGNVVNALTSGKEHIPYRDSKLTRLLQDSIGGNSRTCMLITVSPHTAQATETLSTLRFGQRAAHVCNKPTASVTRSLADYKALVEKLTQDIDEYDGMVEMLQKREQEQAERAEQAQAALQSQQAHCDNLTEQLAAAKAAAGAAAMGAMSQEAATQLTAELQDAALQINVLEEQLTAAFDRQQDAHQSAVDAQEQLDRSAASHQKITAQLLETTQSLQSAEEELERLTTALATAHSERDELTTALATAHSERDELTPALATAHSERDDATALLRDRVEDTQSAFQARLSAKETELQQLRGDCSEVHARNAALCEALAAKTEEAAAAGADAAALRDALTAVQAEQVAERAAHVTNVQRLQSNSSAEIRELKTLLDNSQGQVQDALRKKLRLEQACDKVAEITRELNTASEQLEVTMAENIELEERVAQGEQELARERKTHKDAAAAAADAAAARSEIVALKQQLQSQQLQLVRVEASAGDANSASHRAAAASQASTGALMEEVAALRAALNAPKQTLRKQLAALQKKNIALEQVMRLSVADSSASALRAAGLVHLAPKLQAAEERLMELDAEVLRLRTARDLYRSDCRSIMSLVTRTQGGTAVISPLAKSAMGRRHSMTTSPQRQPAPQGNATPPRRAIPAGFSPFACHMQSPRAPTHVFEAVSASISTAGGTVDCGSIIASTGVGMQAAATPPFRRVLGQSSAGNRTPSHTPKPKPLRKAESVMLVSPSGVKSPYR